MDDAERRDIAARLALTTGRLNRRMRSAGGGLSHGMLSALATVAKLGPLRLAELAQLEVVSAPSTTRLVAELEAQGLVSRESDPDDGRAFLISATDEGLEIINLARSLRADAIDAMFDNLEPAELDSIVNAMSALEKLLEG
jgi:DNA-binding MarR family transcriptional regulator